MASDFDVLVDTDAFIAWFVAFDLLHQPATDLFAKLIREEVLMVATNWVVMETATVLSYRVGQDQARRFLKHLENSRFPTIRITDELEQDTVSLFKHQNGRGVSMVDCANAVFAKHLAIPRIFSFDKFYKRLNLATVR